MGLMEIIAALVALAALVWIVMAARQAAAFRRKEQDSVDSGSSWTTDFGDGDGGGD